MFVKFCHSAKEKYLLLSKKTVKTLFHFSTTYLCKVRCSLCNSTRTCLIGVNAEADMKTQLSSINPNINKISKKN